MEWELSKENFQPLKQGRNPEKLAGAAPSPALARTTMEQERREFWRTIAEYSGPDPLEPWLRFIKWTQANYPAGGHQAELLPLLERCTRELQKQESYKGDVRYLRIWIQYADCLPEPRDVFAFLMENDIGQDFALFYIAYAAYLELRGNFAKAQAVFESGMQRMAVPVNKLHAKYDDFKERMERRRLRNAQEGEMPLSAENDQSSRETLGVLKAKGPEARRSRPPHQEARGIVAPPRQKELAASVDKENSLGLEVYVDDEFRPGAASGASDFGLSSQRKTGGWDKLSSFESTRKENEQQPSKWKGNRFKQNKALMPTPDPLLEIPVDEDLRDVAPIAMKPPKRVETRASHRLEEELAHDPLRLFKDPTLSADHAHQQEKLEKPAYSKLLVTGPDGKELSFEEVRASIWLDRDPVSSEVPPGPQGTSPGMASSACTSPISGSQAAPGCRQVRSPAGGSPQTRAQQQDSSPDSNVLNAGRTGPLHRKPSLPGSGHDPAAATATRTADVTINTQVAFESINGMFKGALPHDSAWHGCNATATLRLPDPTVTISTRAAFDEVNSMFKTSLPHEAQRSKHTMHQPIGRKSLGKQQSRDAAPESLSDPPRASLEDETGRFTVYEDTDLLETGITAPPGKTPKHNSRAAREQTERFAVYEDTDFLPGNRPVRESMNEQTEGFAVYEDTEFLTSSKAAGQVGNADQTEGFFVYQDTDLPGNAGVGVKGTPGSPPSGLANDPPGTTHVRKGDHERHGRLSIHGDQENAPPGTRL